MATNQDTIWENFLAPFFRTFLIDEVQLNKLRDSIDWEKETGAFQQPNLVYPDYYSSENFHGIEGGYLTTAAAVTYDPITQYVLPPSETWVRQMAIKSIEVQPSRIVDLGCGTGSTTVLLKSAFPQAEVTGLDLSPYMLVMATRKGQQAEKHINWIQADAQDTGLPEASYDLVTASLLFHETPPTVSEQIFLEASRLLKPGGQMIVLDGNQRILRQTQWLTQIFEEPYIQAYAQESLDAWMGAAGLTSVSTEDYFWLHQVTRGRKPHTFGVNRQLDLVSTAQ